MNLFKAHSLGRPLINGAKRCFAENLRPDTPADFDYEKPHKNKVAIVTGSTKGIGFEIAKKLAVDGAHVVVSSRCENNVADAVAKLKEQNLSADGMTCEITKEKDRKRIIESTFKEHGRLDILVPTAGVDPKDNATILDTTEEKYAEMFDLNVKAKFFMVKEAIPYLEPTQGTVTIVCSGAAHIGEFEPSIYYFSKIAEGLIAKAFVGEFVKRKMRINSVALGLFDTESGKKMFNLNERWDYYKELVAMGRLGKVEECAGMVSFLNSADTSYISGETFPVGGGLFYRL